MTSPTWLRLLAELPPDEGECHAAKLEIEPFVGWQQVRLVLGDGSAGLRVLAALYDPSGRPGMVSDVIATSAGHRQESIGARLEPDGRIRGTHWLTEGDHHTPRPVTEAEQRALRLLADSLWQRCSSGGATA